MEATILSFPCKLSRPHAGQLLDILSLNGVVDVYLKAGMAPKKFYLKKGDLLFLQDANLRTDLFIGKSEIIEIQNSEPGNYRIRFIKHTSISWRHLSEFVNCKVSVHKLV